MLTSSLNTLHSKYQDNIQESISGFSERYLLQLKSVSLVSIIVYDDFKK